MHVLGVPTGQRYVLTVSILLLVVLPVIQSSRQRHQCDLKFYVYSTLYSLLHILLQSRLGCDYR